MRQPQKYIRQARLPKGAYDGLTNGLNYYAEKDKKIVKFCPNHPQRIIKDEYAICWYCYIKGEK